MLNYVKMDMRKFCFTFSAALLLCLLFFPPLAYVLSIVMLLVLYSTKTQSQLLLILSLVSSFCALNIFSVSTPNFIMASDDFITYYNNYLHFLSGDYLEGMTEFSFGFEFGVPTINYLLSIFIGEPLPYIVKLAHVLILNFIVLIILFQIRRSFELSVPEFALLIAATMLLYKSQYLFLVLRQGYSTLFICMALFSLSNKIRVACFFIACSFHLSAVVVYPLVFFIMLNVNKKRTLSLILICLLSVSSIYLIAGNVSSLKGVFFINKLNFVLLYLSNDKVMLSNVISNFKAVLYFLPLIYLYFSAKILGRSCNGFLPFFTFMVISLATLTLPGISMRILMPIYVILGGFMYFKFLVLDNRFKNFNFIFYSILAFSTINSFVFSQSYYYRFPMYSYLPGYYLGSLFEEKSIRTERYDLPDSVSISNEYK